MSASVAAAVAVLTAFVLTAPRESDGRARHSAVRTTRGAMQRLDAGDVLVHGFDDQEPVMTPAADGVGNFAPSASNDSSPPGAAILTNAPSQGFDSASTLGSVRSTHSRALSRPYRPALGRAPPSL